MNTEFWLIAAALFLGTVVVARMTQPRRRTGPLLRAFQIVWVVAMLGYGLAAPRHRLIAFVFVLIGVAGIYRRARAERVQAGRADLG